jgi:hypothetical protein
MIFVLQKCPRQLATLLASTLPFIARTDPIKDEALFFTCNLAKHITKDFSSTHAISWHRFRFARAVEAWPMHQFRTSFCLFDVERPVH